jgi:site-specific recombinase XerD
MEKFLNSEKIISLFEFFIRDSSLGIRVKKDGKRIRHSSVDNYRYTLKHLNNYVQSDRLDWKIYYYNRLNQREREQAKRYNRRFYQSFTQFLYDQGFYDNYVGMLIKCLKAFYSYLENDRNIIVGPYHKSFVVPVEEVQIIALTPKQFSYIMHNQQFNEKVIAANLEQIRDVFVFGCTVALRFSDLMALDKKNISKVGGFVYLKVKSQKSSAYTSIKLPQYAIDIIDKYEAEKKLLPTFSKWWFNKELKRMGELLPGNMEVVKTRERNGKQVVIYKNEETKENYTIADLLSSHVMRRTAITTMLSLGMPEHLVRKISGHAPNSKSFFRYVQYTQHMLDAATDDVFGKLSGEKKRKKTYV